MTPPMAPHARHHMLPTSTPIRHDRRHLIYAKDSCTVRLSNPKSVDRPRSKPRHRPSIRWRERTARWNREDNRSLGSQSAR
jgi:hypothetical protein